MSLMEDTPEQSRALAARIAQCDPDLVNWIEKQALDALDARIASGNAIASRTNGLLAVLLGAMAAAGSLAVKVLDAAPPVAAWGALSAAAYLLVLVAYMARAAMSLRDAPPARTRPGLLAAPGRTLIEVRSGELARVDERIRQQTALNDARAAVLNRITAYAIGAPLAFAAGCLAAWAMAR